MASTEQILGKPVAAEIREEVRDQVHELEEQGTVPTLGTVLMSDDPGDERFMDLKHAACDDVGIASRDVRLDSTEPEARLHRTVDDLCADPKIHAVFVQIPLPDHVEMTDVRRRIEPGMDVDCFHPENLGRLVDGDPRFVPATPAAVLRLLAAHDVSTEGKDITIVGRSNVIGKPLANLLMQDTTQGNATVTVCHSRTQDLGVKTRQADIVVTACGVPELIDGSMLSPGVVAIDVSANRQASGNDTEIVGDIEFESAKAKASAITPVPGGVGPVTLAALLQNVVRAAERQTADEMDGDALSS